MKRLMIIAMLALSACATVTAESPAQSVYRAIGAYKAAIAGARVYAQSPTADPEIVAAIATATREAKPVVALGQAFAACAADPSANPIDPLGIPAPCGSFDFSTVGLRNIAIGLQTAAIQLRSR